MVVNTPPMGWNTWNTFGPNINEQLIMESADAMVASGLKDAGYEYVVIDDIWSLRERDENGRLVPDPEKFPHGMKYVADYIHSKGLKFGMYSCSGFLTCAGYPGSYGYEWKDAQSFAEWEVDFLKYDYCFRPNTVRPDILYKRMSLALANCGRDILFSACSWGADNTRQWIKETGAHMWRSTGDINDSWESIRDLSRSQLPHLAYNGKGCFNDLDMLVVGMNGDGNVGLKGCTNEEYRFHFSLWSLLNSPLMAGCDIRNMSEETKKILLNRDVIAINQDPLGSCPFFVNNGSSETEDSDLNTCMAIAKYLDGGDIAVGIFNFADTTACGWQTTVTQDLLGLPLHSGKALAFTDMWSGETTRAFNGTLTISLEPHDCRLYRVKVVDA